MTAITITTTKAAYPGNLADEYLNLKAQIAELKVQEDALKQALLAAGDDVVEGNFGRVTISRRSGSVSIDYARAAKEMLSADVLSKFKKVSKASIVFNVRARIGDEEKVA